MKNSPKGLVYVLMVKPGKKQFDIIDIKSKTQFWHKMKMIMYTTDSHYWRFFREEHNANIGHIGLDAALSSVTKCVYVIHTLFNQ